MATNSSPEYPYPGGTPGAEAPDPVAGKPGHFAWSRWIKQYVKNLNTNLMAHQDAANPHPQYGLGQGITDHGALTGLADDDHPQYQKWLEKGQPAGYAALDGTGKVPIAQVPTGTSTTSVSLGDHAHTLDWLSDVATSGAATGHALIFNGTSWSPGTAVGGTSVHGELSGLSNPDHPIAAVQGLQAALDGKAPTVHTHALGDLPTTLATDAEVTTAIDAHNALPSAHAALRGVINPVTITAATPVVGTASAFSREDHKHDVAIGNPVALGTLGQGSAVSLSRSDHVHPMPTAANVGADPAGTAASAVSAHVALPDPHPQYVLESQVGNLLTENQASGTDTLGTVAGFKTGIPTTATWATNAITSSTVQARQGSRSLAFTTSVTTNQMVSVVPSTLYTDFPRVLGGKPYTIQMAVWCAAAEAISMRVYYYTAAGAAASVASETVAYATATAAGWTTLRYTVATPADAAFLAFGLYRASGAAGTQFYLDEIGLWAGAGGDWAMPGTPITNLQSSWESVTLWADLPASGNWLGRRMKVTSGLGLCVALWTGTAWVVAPESDTGWSNAVTLINSWTGILYLRRSGSRVTANFYNLTGASGAPYILKPGYRQTFPDAGQAVSANSLVAIGALYIDGAAAFTPGGAAKGYAGAYIEASWATEPTWPTTAP